MGKVKWKNIYRHKTIEIETRFHFLKKQLKRRRWNDKETFKSSLIFKSRIYPSPAPDRWCIDAGEMLCWSGSVRRKQKPGHFPVYLNVYDLTPMNAYGYWLGLGVFHSGVEGELCSVFFLIIDFVYSYLSF